MGRVMCVCPRGLEVQNPPSLRLYSINYRREGLQADLQERILLGLSLQFLISHFGVEWEKKKTEEFRVRVLEFEFTHIIEILTKKYYHIPQNGGESRAKVGTSSISLHVGKASLFRTPRLPRYIFLLEFVFLFYPSRVGRSGHGALNNCGSGTNSTCGYFKPSSVTVFHECVKRRFLQLSLFRLFYSCFIFV